MNKCVCCILSAVLLVLMTCCRKTAGNNVELIIANGGEPQSIDPVRMQNTHERRVYLALFEGLVNYDPKTCHAAPGVAERWEINADGTKITFYLRDARWSDGVAITAQTFVDSWLYYLASATAAGAADMLVAVIKGAGAYHAGAAGRDSVGIRAIDTHTLEVMLTNPASYAVDMMAHYAFSPLPMHIIEKYGKDWTQPGYFTSNGPFVLESWIPTEKLTVVRNNDYWNRENVFISRIVFLPTRDTASTFSKFKKGKIDWITSSSIPADMLGELHERKDFQVSPLLGSYYYYFNCTDPVLKDVRVRKALLLSLNCSDLVKNITQGGELATGSFVPPMEGYTPILGVLFDPVQAKKLLSAAGYGSPGMFPRLSILYNKTSRHKKIAEWVREQWRENLGIAVEFKEMDWGSYVDACKNGKFQIARDGWVADYMDPVNFLKLLDSDSDDNFGLYSNPEFDRLLRVASSLPEGAERMQMLHDAEEIAVVRDAAVIPLFMYVNQNLIDLAKWEGWYTNSLDVHPYPGMRVKR